MPMRSGGAVFPWVQYALHTLYYLALIWVAWVGRKRMPGRGWGLILISMVLQLLRHAPSFMFQGRLGLKFMPPREFPIAPSLCGSTMGAPFCWNESR